MVVPLNGAFCRLLCKFVAIFAVLLLLTWSLSQHQKSATELAELEGQLRFAQEQLSSLHTQIDVITRHKEKIESLLREERQGFEQIKNEHSERIAHLEAENARCAAELANLNGTLKAKNVGQIAIDTKNRSNAVENERIDGQNGGMEEQQQPIVEPEGEKEEEEEEEERPKRDELDPFEGENGGGIVGQIKAPNDEEKKQQQTRKEPNGGEKQGEDYIFRRPVPRDDLVFHREAEKELDEGKKENWMNGGELMRKLEEKKKTKKREKTAEIQQQEDQDFRE